MKLKFDANLPYQQEAIASVIDLFAGPASLGAGKQKSDKSKIFDKKRASHCPTDPLDYCA